MVLVDQIAKARVLVPQSIPINRVADTPPDRLSPAADQPHLYRTETLSVTNYRDNDAWTKREGIYRLLPVQPQAELVRRIGLRGSERILDVGIANGRIPAYMRATGHTGSIIGVDINKGMMKEPIRYRAEHDMDLDLSLAKLPSLPFKSQSFDVVIASNILYHVPDIPAALAELYRILKDDGKLVVATFGSSRIHLPAINEVKTKASILLGQPNVQRVIDRFSVENADTTIEGPLLGTDGRFSVINQDRWLDLPAVSSSADPHKAIAPFVAYLDSTADLYFPEIGRENWQALGLPLITELFLQLYDRKEHAMKDRFLQGIYIAQKRKHAEPNWPGP